MWMSLILARTTLAKKLNVCVVHETSIKVLLVLMNYYLLHAKRLLHLCRLSTAGAQLFGDVSMN